MVKQEENKTYQKEIHGKQFILRTDTWDENVAKETCYKNINCTKDDIWLDIGGNIGIFPVYYGDRAKLIYSFEPDVQNLELMNKNLKLNHITNCIVYPEAVVWDDREETEFYLNTKKNKGAHSLFVTRGRNMIAVPCVNINQVLEDTKANKIKMDVEGAEYELIKAIENWDNITELIFEYHIAILKDSDGLKLGQLYKLLTRAGFNVTGRPKSTLGKLWFTVIHCVK
jgi:FkbM family methyltransferase